MGRKKPRRPTSTQEERLRLQKHLIMARTDLLRLSDEPRWARIRQLIEVQGVDPYSAVFVDSEQSYSVFGEDVPDYRSDFGDGFIVTGDGRVFYYRATWEATWETASFTIWRDITGSWTALMTHFQGTPNRAMIAVALEVLTEEQ